MARLGHKLTDSELNDIHEQVWESIIQDIIIETEIQHHNIHVTDREVSRAAMENPPDFIRNLDKFHIDGRFSEEKYRDAMLDPRNREFFISLENHLREFLAVQKLTDLIEDSVTVSEEEVRQAYIKKSGTEERSLDEAAFQSSFDQIKEELLARKKQEVLRNWYESSKQRADIKDYRRTYYTDNLK
jgi:hypothetical protein